MDSKKRHPRETYTRPEGGERDIPELGPDVEGHLFGDPMRQGGEAAIPGAPGSDGFLGEPRTGGEYRIETDETGD